MNIIIIPACAIICLYGSRVEEQWMVIAWPQVRQVKREGRREESSPTPCEEEPLELWGGGGVVFRQEKKSGRSRKR
jgi:hypothetical protein